MSLSISLAMITRRFAKKHILLKSITSIEQLSETTCLCIPFQGSFTTNIMNVNSIWYGNKEYDAKEMIISNKSSIHNNQTFDHLLKCCILTSDHKYSLFEKNKKHSISKRKSISMLSDIGNNQ